MNLIKLSSIFILALLVSAMELSAQSTEKKVKYEYLAYTPANYDSTKSDLYPVIIYLHGRSVSGTDLNRVRRYGLPYFLDKGKKLDFIVIAPQCPWRKNWASEDWLDTLYSEVCTKYRVDSSMVYLTGMSLGGFGTWELANRYPHKFAAIAPLCGGAKDEWVENLTHLPIWVFHGVKDSQVSVSRSDRMVEALKAYEAPVVYSRFAEKGHDIHSVYNDDNLYEWFKRFTLRPFKEETGLYEIKRIQLAEIQQPELEKNKQTHLMTR